jgi:MFS family permease
MREAPIGKAENGPNKESLASPGFLGLNAVFFIASAAVSSFFYLQQHLQSLGIGPEWTGLIIGADAVASLVLQPFLAPFLHAGNARRWMLGGVAVMAGSLFCYGGAHGLAALLVVRIVQGAGFACLVAAMMAAMASYIPPSLSGKAFGYISLVRLVPYALVPPLVTFLMSRNFTFPAVVAGFAILVLLSVPLLRFVRPPADLSAHEPVRQWAGFGGLRDNLRKGPVVLLLGANLLFFITYTVVFFYMVGFSREAGIAQPGLFFTVATAVMIVVRLFGSPYFDKVSKPLVSLACLVVLAAGFVLLVHSRDWVFLFLAVVFGSAWGVVMPLLNALVFDVSEPRFRGLNLNLALVTMQGAFFLGPLIGGLVVGAWGYPALFYSCCPLSLAAGLLVMGIKRKGVMSS